MEPIENKTVEVPVKLEAIALKKRTMKAPLRWFVTALVVNCLVGIPALAGIVLVSGTPEDFFLSWIGWLTAAMIFVICWSAFCLFGYLRAVRLRNKAVRKDIQKRLGLKVPISFIEQSFPRDYRLKNQQKFARVDVSNRKGTYSLEFVTEGKYTEGTITELVSEYLDHELTY